MAQEVAFTKRTTSIYEEIQHPNEEHEEDEVLHPGQLDKEGKRVGWTGSSFYNWFARYDEEKLRPFLIRNYDRD